MSNDAESGLSNEPAADKPNLDAIFDAAYAEHMPADTVAPPGDPAAADGAAGGEPDVKIDATGRHHGNRGKFVPKANKDTAAPAASNTEPAADAAATTGANAPADPATQLQLVEPPARLTPEDKAIFAELPRDQQETVARWHKGFEADYTRKTQEAADLRRSAEPLLNAVKPFEQYLTSLAPTLGQTPAGMVGELLNVEYTLRTGQPQQKAQALQHIAQSYGIDLAALARGEMPAAPDPAYQQLRQSYGDLQSRFSKFEQDIAEQQDRQNLNTIQSFADAKDEAGQPRYPHFLRVRVVMGQMMRAEQGLTMEQAYQKAMEPINQAIAEGLRTQSETAERQRQEAVERARKALPVRTQGTAPNGSAATKDLDSILSAAIDRSMPAAG